MMAVRQYLYAESVNHIFGQWLIKAAFLCMYWNLDSAWSPRLVRSMLYGTATLLVTTYVVMLAIFLGYCHPMSDNW